MNKLVLYEDMDGNEMVLLCDEDFYKGVFGDGDIKVTDEIIIDEDYDLRGWPTNRPWQTDF